MSAPGILLCLLIVLLLIGQIRVGCKAAYDHEGVQVWVRVASFYLRVFPLKKKDKQKPEKKKKARKKKEKPNNLGFSSLQNLYSVLFAVRTFFTSPVR